MGAREVMISRVTASGSGMCGVLPFVFFFFSLILRKWLRELAFFLGHFTSFHWNFAFLLYWFIFPVVSLFAQNKCKMVGISLVQINELLDVHSLCS